MDNLVKTDYILAPPTHMLCWTTCNLLHVLVDNYGNHAAADTSRKDHTTSSHSWYVPVCPTFQYHGEISLLFSHKQISNFCQRQCSTSADLDWWLQEDTKTDEQCLYCICTHCALIFLSVSRLCNYHKLRWQHPYLLTLILAAWL